VRWPQWRARGLRASSEPPCWSSKVTRLHLRLAAKRRLARPRCCAVPPSRDAPTCPRCCALLCGDHCKNATSPPVHRRPTSVPASASTTVHSERLHTLHMAHGSSNVVCRAPPAPPVSNLGARARPVPRQGPPLQTTTRTERTAHCMHSLLSSSEEEEDHYRVYVSTLDTTRLVSIIEMFYAAPAQPDGALPIGPCCHVVFFNR
jgi:hypothetical protein